MSIKGERIRDRRKSLGLTQDDLAGLLNTDQKNIYQYEKGKSGVNDDTLAALASALNTSTDYLLGRTDDPTPPSEMGSINFSWYERHIIEVIRKGDLREALRLISDKPA